MATQTWWYARRTGIDVRVGDMLLRDANTRMEVKEIFWADARSFPGGAMLIFAVRLYSTGRIGYDTETYWDPTEEALVVVPEIFARPGDYIEEELVRAT
jgi:hypothetical protein